METTFENKCQILSEVWMNYRTDEDFADFVEYNDLGLPLAYVIDSGIVKCSPMAASFINESFRLLLAGLDIKEDVGFEVLSDVLEHAEE